MSNQSPQRRPLPRASLGYAPMVILLTAAAFGAAADRFAATTVWGWLATVLAALVGWAALWARRRDRTAAVAVWLAVAAAAGLWHHLHRNLYPTDEVGRFARGRAEPVCVTVEALKRPQLVAPPAPNPLATSSLETATRLDCELRAIRDGDAWRPCSGRTQLRVVGKLEGIAPGDRLQVFGYLMRVEPAANPGGFDFADYQRDNRILCQLRSKHPECVTILQEGVWWSPRRALESVRAAGARLLAAHLDASQSPLASAVLLGQREQIDDDLSAAFIETGTVHILSISGMHIAILAGVVMFLLRFVPIGRGWKAGLVTAFTVFYTLMVDSQAPVVRATVVIAVLSLATSVRRGRSSFNALALAGLVVLAINPADLFRVGTQLSFLCVAVLIWTAPQILGQPIVDPLDRLIEASRTWGERATRTVWSFIRQVTLASGAVWLFTAPLVLARFDLLSPVSLVLNTLIWWPVELAMVSGFATVTLGAVWPPLGELAGWVCNLSFRAVEGLVYLGRGIPGGHVWLPGPADWWLAGFYGGLGLLVALPGLRPPRRWCVALAAGWVAVGFGASWWQQPKGRLTCSFLSMGHGAAVLLELPGGEKLLYDAGRFGAPENANRSISGALWSKGITHLDAVVLSHCDSDHYNAIPELLERFSVGVVYVSPVMFEDMNSGLDVLRAAIDRYKVPIRVLRAGERLAVGGGCRVEVLHPPRNGILGSANANSLVLCAEYAGRRILLPGDLEPPGFEDLLAESPLHSDVLLVPHHGSQSSNPPGLAAWATPQWVIISGSHRWETATTEAAYTSAGAQVFHTADVGAVEVRIDGRGMSMTTLLKPVMGVIADGEMPE